MRAGVLEELDILYEHVQERSDDTLSENIIHVQEHPNGSSYWLFEACDIDSGDGYKECSNWNYDLHKRWSLEQLYHKNNELTANQLIEVFDIFDEMWILKKREPILNKLTQKDLKKLHELYERYKRDNRTNK